MFHVDGPSKDKHPAGEPQIQPIKKGIVTAARLGAAGVEIDARGELRPSAMGATAVRQFRKMLEDHGLGVAAVRFATRRGYHEVAELDRRIEATKQAMSWAYELGTQTVVNHVGYIASDETSAEWKTPRRFAR